LKLVTIVRHAHAERVRTGSVDFRRELDARGRAEAEEMAALAHRLGLRPDRLLASPAARTLATARAFTTALGLEPQRLHAIPEIYDAELATLAALLRALPEEDSHALLVGHNPGVSLLAHWLSGDVASGSLPPAALLTLRSEVATWSQLEAGACVTVSLDWPGSRTAGR
jgi:phosphohistidine phosphatase